MTQFEELTFPQHGLMYFLSRVADRPRVIIEIHQQVLRKSQSFKLGHAEEAFKDKSNN